MKRLMSIGACLAWGLAAALPGTSSTAQVMYTPPGCQWLDAGGGDQDLYCRDEDGRAYRTQTRRRDMGGSMDVCLRGQLDDGMGCVSESDARRAQAFGLRYDPMVKVPPPFDWKASKTPDGKWRDPNRPDVMIYGDGRGGWRTGYIFNTPD